MRNRPYRVAFLVNPETDSEMLDVIIEYNRGKWGGRFNPVFFTDGNSMDDVWWANLRSYDPDIVYSIPNLGDDLKRRIKTFLSPLRIKQQREGERFISIHDDPISIQPTVTNLSKVGLGFANDPVTLCYFIIDDETPDNIKQFLTDNFGTVSEYDLRYVNVTQFRDAINYRDFRIHNLNDLNEALLAMGDWRNRFVFHSQFCCLPNSLKETDYSNDGEKFEIIIGDSVQAKAYAWNRQLDVRHWLRTQIMQLLISEELFNDESIRPGLTAFTNRHTSVSNDNSRGVRYVSFSMNQEQLETIRRTVGREVRYPQQVEVLSTAKLLNYQRYGSFLNVGRGMDFHRANTDEEVITIREPDIEEGIMGGQGWFVDIYIEYRPERFRHIIGSNYWWQLPKRNSIVRDCGFFNRAARINERGTFSVLMRRSNQFSPDENILEVKVPDDASIFHSLFCGEKFDNIDEDEGARYHSQPFYYMQRSDKGMYLSGVLSLFSNLSQAKHLFEQRFWRTLFERMSNRDPEKDLMAKKKVVDKLEKAVKRGNVLTDESNVPWLADKVFSAAKDLSSEEVDMDYEEMTQMAMEETDKFNGERDENAIPFNETEYKETLSDLVEATVLLMGVKPKCPYCGYRIWYHIDDVNTKIKCHGCGHNYSINAQEPWFYRVNSLVRAAVSKHGTIPLLLSLGELLQFSRSSSMAIPSHELLQKDGDDLKPVREVDLICIKDGKFIIGEIKTSNSGFSPSDFDEMIDLAKQVKPDAIVFSSMDREASAAINAHIERVRTELAPLEIDVRWLGLSRYAFAPHPVR